MQNYPVMWNERALQEQRVREWLASGPSRPFTAISPYMPPHAYAMTDSYRGMVLAFAQKGLPTPSPTDAMTLHQHGGKAITGNYMRSPI